MSHLLQPDHYKLLFIPCMRCHSGTSLGLDSCENNHTDVSWSDKHDEHIYLSNFPRGNAVEDEGSEQELIYLQLFMYRV
jgi:hypothetical protein